MDSHARWVRADSHPAGFVRASTPVGFVGTSTPLGSFGFATHGAFEFSDRRLRLDVASPGSFGRAHEVVVPLGSFGSRRRQIRSLRVHRRSRWVHSLRRVRSDGRSAGFLRSAECVRAAGSVRSAGFVWILELLGFVRSGRRSSNLPTSWRGAVPPCRAGARRAEAHVRCSCLHFRCGKPRERPTKSSCRFRQCNRSSEKIPEIGNAVQVARRPAGQPSPASAAAGRQASARGRVWPRSAPRRRPPA